MPPINLNKGFKKDWEKIDELTKQGLLVDRELNFFLEPVFPNTVERVTFIRRCLKKLKTRRMLLRAQWYTHIADDQEKVRNNRPALKIIFLIALAEAVTKMRISTNNIGSLEAIKNFFKYILPTDKRILMNDFQRALTKPKHHTLRFSSIISILYDVRNKAVHGEDYYSFSLLDNKRKNEFKTGEYTDWGLMTFGDLGKQNRKRRVTLDTRITYDELRDIFRRTAIENIKSLFR